MATLKKNSISHPDKILWPREKVTKGQLYAYYESMAEYILPYLKGRPQSLHRFPNGIEQPSFYQKNMGDHRPSWMTVADVYSKSENKTTHYMVCNSKRDLMYMVNMGCIEMNPWNSTADRPEYPDYMALDLDPHETSFQRVVEAARIIRDMLDDMGIPAFFKTSGATGIHIYIPTGGIYPYEIVRQFAHRLAMQAHEEMKAFTSLERHPGKRRHRVYIDYLQNSRGQTLASPYSVRPVRGACVSAPILHEEITEQLKPSDFNIFNMHERILAAGDLFKGIFGKGIDIEKHMTLWNEMQQTKTGG
jgi:bifunctional non-homologous end joining protein LigD